MTKNITEPPSWLLKAIKKDAHMLPVMEEHASSLQHIKHAFEQYEKKYKHLNKQRDFSILDSAAFQKNTKPVKSNKNDSQSATLKILEYWDDQLVVADLYNHITMIRGFQLIKTFVRDARTNDVFAMALSGRAILELGIVASDTIRKPMAYFKHIAENGRMPITDSLQADVEETLVKAIWGSRIGTGNLGDGKKNRPNTPLYDTQQVPEGLVTAKNIITAFQGRAKRIGSERGKSEYKIYEILSDIVHPSALGYQMLLFDNNKHSSSHEYRVKKYELHQHKANYAALAAAFGAYQGCGLIFEMDSTFNDVMSKSKSNIDKLKKQIAND